MASRQEWAHAVEKRITALEARVAELEADDEYPGPESVAESLDKLFKAPPEPPPKGFYLDEDGNVVTAPATARQHRMRLDLVDNIGLDELEMIEEGAARHAFIKGGPLWLLTFDQHFVERLPDAFRRIMVEDIQITDADEAKNWGAHLLKYDTTESIQASRGRVEAETFQGKGDRWEQE